jgi:glucosamine--fructose-6-phosphate aminotransferase (isomerizing)
MPEIGRVRAVGAVTNLREKLEGKIGGTVGIAHTRWATHGEPTETNAHPHTDEHERIFAVHNGIIENYRDIRDDLEKQGKTFYSDTDTEVLVSLIASLVELHGDLEKALHVALLCVRGTYGIAVMDKEDPERVFVARMGSPIVLGVASHGLLVASDPSALLAHTKDVVYLEDGEYAILTADNYKVLDFTRTDKTRKPEKIEWDQEAAKKEGYDHFMIKEIMEGPEVLRNTMRGRTIKGKGLAKLGGLESVEEVLRTITRLCIVACGSAYYAGMVGKNLIEQYAGIPVDIDIASEYRYRPIIPQKESAVLVVSQSGETADTLCSIKKAKELGLLTLGIVNAVGSTIARETDSGIYNHAGPEVSVASTKAFISQIEVFILLTLFLARDRGMSREDGQAITKALEALPSQVEKILKQHEHIKSIAEQYVDCKDFLCIGRGVHVPIAYEGALKLKETSYVHAEAFGAGEMKHGPIALIDKQFPTIAIVLKDELYEKNISNIEEIKARKGPIIALATEGDQHIKDLVDHVIYIPACEHEIIAPVLTTVPFHLFAYYLGTAKGINVDRPRNLAKSVTVE